VGSNPTREPSCQRPSGTGTTPLCGGGSELANIHFEPKLRSDFGAFKKSAADFRVDIGFAAIVARAASDTPQASITLPRSKAIAVLPDRVSPILQDTRFMTSPLEIRAPRSRHVATD
jgi:hypothetical protein